MTSISIKNWVKEERPREKLLIKGSGELSNTELLAILIQNGTASKSAIDLARELLASCNNSLPELCHRSIAHFTKIKGIGQAKAITIKAALELGIRRESEFNSQENKSLNCSEKIFNLLKQQTVFLKQEVFGVLFLNNQLQVIQNKIITKGGITQVVVDIRLILKYAFEYDAINIVVYHNHLSEKSEPSEHDKIATQEIKKACQTCRIELLDHLIVAPTSYFSFKDNLLL